MMRQTLNIWVIGGDMRQAKLAELLSEDGHDVHTFALERLELSGPGQERACTEIFRADCVVLPLPVTAEGSMLNAPMACAPRTVLSVLELLHPRQIICGGRVDGEVTVMAEELGLTLHDYFAREELAVANAVPTAEGAVQLAMEELPITLRDARVLVIGFGRVGKLAARRFAAMGARVSVAARRCADLAWIEALGYTPEHTEKLEGWLCGYDCVVNTAPARVLGEERLRELKPGCVVLDLASKPGGVDFEAAARMGVRAVWALSLPGKVAPVTAGRAIRDTLYNIWTELGV